MVLFTRISSSAWETRDRAAATWRATMAQPGWIRRLALMTFLIVIGLPIALLLLLAAAAAIGVFLVLALANAILLRLGRALPVRDGRQNVRVIRREQPPGPR